MPETKEVEPKTADKAEKGTKGTIEEKPYGEVDQRWHEMRSSELFFVLPLPAPEPAEGEEPVEGEEAPRGGYVIYSERSGAQEEITAEAFDAMSLAPVPPAKRL